MSTTITNGARTLCFRVDPDDTRFVAIESEGVSTLHRREQAGKVLTGHLGNGWRLADTPMSPVLELRPELADVEGGAA